MQKSHILSLSLLLLVGCSLSMEEDLFSEDKSAEELEEVGFDEPYTQETEYGDITFQYSDSTVVLKQAAMDYLISVDADSILCFSDNIPTDLLIRPGHYVSAPCSHILPTGLCNYVESLTHEAGMYRMVTRRAGMEQVFDELDVSLNIDYILTHDIVIPDSEECVAMGLDPECPLITDYDILDGVSTPARVKAMRMWKEEEKTADIALAKSRGCCYESNDDGMEVWTDGETEDIDDRKGHNTSKTAELFKFNSSSSGELAKYFLPGSALAKALSELSDAGLEIELSVNEIIDQNVTVDIQLDKKNPKNTVRKETIVDKSHYKISYSVSEGGAPFDLEYIYSKYHKKIEALLKKSSVDKDAWRNDRSFVINIPFPSMPALFLYLEVTPQLSCDIGFMGKVGVNIYKPTSTTTVITKGNKVTRKEGPATSGRAYVTWDPIEAEGFLKISGGVSGYLGASVGLPSGGKSTRLLGLGVGGSLMADLTLNFDTSIGKGEYGLEFSSNTKIEYSIHFDPEAQLTLMGYTLPPFPIGQSINIGEGTLLVTPSLGKGNDASYNIVKDDGHGNMSLNFSGSFSFSNVGLEARANPKRYEPVMALYYFNSRKSTIGEDDKSFVMMNLKSYAGKLEQDKNYIFSYVTTEELGKYYYMIPGYRKDGGEPVLFYDKKMTVSDLAYASMYNAGTYLVEIERDKGGNKYKYHFITKVVMKNTSLISEQWSEMGLYFHHQSFRYFLDKEKTRYSWENSDIPQPYFPANPGLNGDGTYYFHYYYFTDYEEHIKLGVQPYYKTKDKSVWFHNVPGVITRALDVDGLASEYLILEFHPDSKANFKKSSDMVGAAQAGRNGSHD